MRAQADTTTLRTLSPAPARRSKDTPLRLRLVGDDTEEVEMPRVVVISTSGLVRFRLKRELTPRGFFVVDCPDLGGVGATRAVKDAKADVILVDSSATSSACRFLMASLKLDPATRRTPVLLLAADSEAARRDVLAAGADGLIPEVDDFDALAAMLRLHL